MGVYINGAVHAQQFYHLPHVLDALNLNFTVSLHVTRMVAWDFREPYNGQQGTAAHVIGPMEKKGQDGKYAGSASLLSEAADLVDRGMLFL